MTAFLSANSYLGLMPEGATPGVTPTTGTATFIPITTPQVTPMQTFLRDEALRGSPTVVYDQIQGVRHDEVDFKSYLYADTFPQLLTAVLGGNDTVTTVGSLKKHTIGLYNNPVKGSQPQTYSILDFDGANYFLMPGAKADSLNLTFGAEAAADATVKFFANPYTSYTATTLNASTFAPFYSTAFSVTPETMIPAWNTTITVSGINSGATLTYISTGELMFARKTAPIFTMGTQAPYSNFSGPIEVSGKFTAVVDSQSDAWSTGTGAEALTRSQQVMTVTLTDPNDTPLGQKIVFTLSNVQFHDVKRTRGKEYTEVEVAFTANANVTDSGGSPAFSPILTATTNAITTAYQTGW